MNGFETSHGKKICMPHVDEASIAVLYGGICHLFKVDALMGALRLTIQEIEKLNISRTDSRVLRLPRRELAAAEDVAAALLKE